MRGAGERTYKNPTEDASPARGGGRARNWRPSRGVVIGVRQPVPPGAGDAGGPVPPGAGEAPVPPGAGEAKSDPIPTLRANLPPLYI